MVDGMLQFGLGCGVHGRCVEGLAGGAGGEFAVELLTLGIPGVVFGGQWAAALPHEAPV